MIRYKSKSSTSRINALNRRGRIRTNKACQNTIQESISANINQIKPPKKGPLLLYIKSPDIFYDSALKNVNLRI